MFKIEITANSLDELLALAIKLGGVNAPAPVPVQAAPVVAPAPPLVAAPAAAPVSVAPPVVAVPAAIPVAVPAVAVAATGVTLEMVNQAVGAHAAKFQAARTKAILAQYGVAKAKDLQPAQYPTVHAHLSNDTGA